MLRRLSTLAAWTAVGAALTFLSFVVPQGLAQGWQGQRFGIVDPNGVPIFGSGSPGYMALVPSAATSGTPSQVAVSCPNSNTPLLAASAASKFILIQVPATASAGVWFNFAGAAATAATPNIYLAPGSTINWSPMNGFVSRSAVNCISASGTVSVSVTYS